MTEKKWKRRAFAVLACTGALVFGLLSMGSSADAQEQLPWKRDGDTYQDYEPRGRGSNSDWNAQSHRRGDRPDAGGGYVGGSQRANSSRYDNDGYGSGSAYNNGPPLSNDPRDGDIYRDERRFDPPPQTGYGEPYRAPDRADIDRYDDRYDDRAPRRDAERYDRGPRRDGYSQDEIIAAGHGFFGSVSKGLASVIEYAFQRSGRPNGYILGEDAGGAIVAGLRYGEGTLHTRDYGTRKVYWQGPSLGYDFGAEGSRTMVLVYNLRSPSDIYHRFGGVQGSAYLVGGVSIQFQKYGDVVLAPIRSGVGVRLGANIGYLKYTRSPTWNPF